MNGAMRGQSGRVVGVVLVGLAVLLVALAGMSAWQGASRLRGRGAERSQAVTVARTVVEAHGTFDYRQPDAQRARLAAITAGDLREAVAAAAPDPAALAQQRVTAVRIVAAQVISLSRAEASIAVTAEQRRHGRDPATGQPFAADVQQRITVRLVRAPDTWRVTELRLVAEVPIPAAAMR